jgi:hypothetical protein
MSRPVHNLRAPAQTPAQREAARLTLVDRETEDAVYELRELRGVGMTIARAMEQRVEIIMEVRVAEPLPPEIAKDFDRVALAIRRLIVLQQELLGLREPPRRRAPPAERAPQDEDAGAGLDALLGAVQALEKGLDAALGPAETDDEEQDDDDAADRGDPRERDDLYEPDDLDDDRPMEDVLRDVRNAFTAVATQFLPADAAQSLLAGMNFPTAPAIPAPAMTRAATAPPRFGHPGGQGPPPA